MIKLKDGPAAGTYMVKRAPLWLRGVVTRAGKRDVLDQLDDTPDVDESISVYRRVGEAGHVHLNMADRRRTGFYAMAEYVFVPAVGFEPATICHAQGPMRWNGGGHAALWHHAIAKGSKRPDHPCPKPLPLMSKLVSLFTDPGDTILDPFAGSGTTLVAVQNLGRKAIGIELEEKWCEATAERLSLGPLFETQPEKQGTMSL